MAATATTAAISDQHGEHAPERELAPHAAAIDDQVGIERHVENLPRICGRHWLRADGQWRAAPVMVNARDASAAIVANEMETPPPLADGGASDALLLRLFFATLR